MKGADANDTELVNACLGGNRDAFSQIVTRYQALVASIAYSATGSLGQSEDLAQETFLVAWRQLKSLEEPAKLRAWLCGIARRSTANALRGQQREPTQHADPLDELLDSPAPELPPIDHAISREEEAILWRSLEQIPETYREPLILFYRQEQSVERVAQALELSPDAVRQRLSRGRKLLEERVASFVEGALRQSRPGRSFTASVMTLLPGQLATAGLASAGATAAKSSVAKTVATWFGLSPFVSFLPGFVAWYQGYKSDMAGVTSDQGRRAINRFYAVMAGAVAVPVLLIYVAVSCRDLLRNRPSLSFGIATLTALTWILSAVVLLVLMARKLAGGSANDEASPYSPLVEFRTAARFLGLPLIHLRFGGPAALRKQPVKAWIALGDVAFGGLFAMGGLAIAPISFGGLALGALVFGGFSVGAVIYTGIGVGIWAIGGFVVGLQSVGGCAIGWTAAMGGISIAREFAQGGVAVALHANDAIAAAYMQSSIFFRYALLAVTKWLWPTMLAATIPAVFMSVMTRRQKRHAEGRAV